MISNSKKMAYDMLFYKALDKYVKNIKKDIDNKINKYNDDRNKKSALEKNISSLNEDINALEKDISSLNENVKIDLENLEKEDIKINNRKKENKNIIIITIFLSIISFIIVLYKFFRKPSVSSPNPFLNFLTICLIYVIPSIIVLFLFFLGYKFYKNFDFYNKYTSIYYFEKQELEDKTKLYNYKKEELEESKKEIIKYLYVDNSIAYDNEIKYSKILIDRIDNYKSAIKTTKFNLVGDKEFETVFYYLYNEVFDSIEKVLEYIKKNPKKIIRKDKTEIPYILKTEDFIINLKNLINDINISVLLDNLLDDILRDLYKLPKELLGMDVKKDILDKRIIIDNDLIIGILIKMYR